MWTISETKVTTVIISAVSGSTRKPIANLIPSEVIQRYTSPLNVLPASTSRRMNPDAAIDTATPRMHSQCDTARPSFGPHSPTTIAPASGARGTTR